MPELVAIQTRDYEFVVRTKDISSSQERLERTLSSRGKTPSPSCILLSPPLSVKDKDEPVSEFELDGPVFFENKQYEIEFSKVVLDSKTLKWWFLGSLFGPVGYLKHGKIGFSQSDPSKT